MIRIFCSDGKFNHIGLYVAGPAELKDRIQLEDLFESYFKKYLVQTLTIGEITDQTIGCVIKTIGQVVESNEVSKTNDVIATFEAMIADPETFDLIVFGIQNVFDELEAGSIAEVFIVSDTVGGLLPEKFKGIVNVVGSKSFEEKYGSIVGIKYFASENFDLIIETDVSETD
jgi:peptide subunit release factor 1 (eRF1)